MERDPRKDETSVDARTNLAARVVIVRVRVLLVLQSLPSARHRDRRVEKREEDAAKTRRRRRAGEGTKRRTSSSVDLSVAER
jgi:hypothetical protein